VPDLDDLAADGGDLPRRPPPPRTWRDRLDDLVAGGVSAPRVAAALGAVAVAAVVGWRLLAPPAPPPEVAIPFTGAETTTATAGTAGADGPAGVAPRGDVDPAPGGGTEVVVHVVGAVTAPGVQRLPAGARVADAVDAAGGATPDADLGRINLAAVLADGQQVYVLRVGETPPAPVASPGTAAGDGTGPPVNVNTASAAELEELPGVGPATAEAIIAHREQHGPFGSVDDLLDVRGIGEAKLEQLRDRATV
jgi:competence protein ComEA